MSRLGNPNEMFETPSTKRKPSFLYSSVSIRIARTVSRAVFCSELTVSVRVSIKMSRGAMPYFAASAIIFRATLQRPSAVGAIPFSSIQSATTEPP